jgi:hypothetical protein
MASTAMIAVTRSIWRRGLADCHVLLMIALVLTHGVRVVAGINSSPARSGMQLVTL